jgi:hypothetical protein
VEGESMVVGKIIIPPPGDMLHPDSSFFLTLQVNTRER